MLEDYLREYGLSSRQISDIIRYFKTVDGIIDSEDYEIASIGDMSISEAKKLKNFLMGKIEKSGIGNDFLKRWGNVISKTDIEKAYEEYDKLSKIYPESPVVWQIKAELLEKMGKYDKAKDAYLRAYKFYEEKNEIPPSVIEDKVRGKLFHAKNGGNGVGLINGFGMMNGKSVINGLSNGMRNGFKNGIINGSGLVNGAGKKIKRKKPSSGFFRFITTITIILALIYAPLLGTLIFQKVSEFRVDGNFEEWNNVMPYYALRANAPGYMDIVEVKFHEANKGLYFFVETQKNMFTNASGIYIFLDTDLLATTGYRIGNIGADFMVEIFGWNSSVQGATLYVFNSTDQNSFSGFQALSSVPTALRANKLEGFIPHQIKNFRAYVMTTNYKGGHDSTYIPVMGRERAIVVERNNAKIVKFDEKVPLMMMDIYTYGYRMHIHNMTFNFYGTSTPFDMKGLYLYMDNGDGIFDTSDNLITSNWTIKDSRYVFFRGFNVTINGNSTIFLVVECDNYNLTQKTIMMNLTRIGSDLPYYIENEIDEAIYIDKIPTEVQIDGSFDDWRIVKSDPVGDVSTPAGSYKITDENIDIVNYSAYQGNSLYFYVEVNGKMMGGNDIPIVRRPVSPHQPKPPSIGPVPHPKVYGYDTLLIYVNTDGNMSTGFSFPQYPIGADYMVEIYGRDGKVYNATTYKYDNGSWIPFSRSIYYMGYHAIELSSGIHASHAESLFIMSDWDGDYDISNFPFYSSYPMRSGEVHKQLHLHYNATTSTPYLNTTPGNTAYYVQIYAGYSVNWTQFPFFAKNFSIISYPRIQLYLEPYVYKLLGFEFIPGMNVSLWIYNSTTGYREVGYDYNPDVENTGWYNFTISNTTEVMKGESIVLNLTTTGLQDINYINVYFNSSQYDSLIDLPTDTYVNVEWIKTYNASGETDTFNPRENLYVETEISDPFGSYDISNAIISIYYPNGTLLVNNASMNATSSTNSSILFYFDYALPSLGGVYEIIVYGIESNGVIDSNTTYFIIKTEQGVALYPDQTKNGNPDENIYFNLTLENIGNINDTYEIIPSKPSSEFPFALYINGSLAAKDTDGDGQWDWINASWDPDNDGKVEVNLKPLQWVTVTVVKTVPSGSWGDTDLTVFNATSESNSSIYDIARIRVNVPYHSLNKILYLNDTDKLAVKHGTSTSQVSLNNGDSYSWTFSKVYYSINITSYIIIHLYIDASASWLSGVAMKASLYYDSTLIGDDEIVGNSAKWYNFTISPQVNTIPAGSSIILTLSVKGLGVSATVYYNSSQYPSNITIPTTDYIKIRSINLYNSSGYQTDNFSAGEDVIVKTRITSPFGADDIGIAYLNITDPIGNKKVDSQSMNLISANGGDKIYQYTYSLPNDSWSGYWNVRVDVHDDPVIQTNASTRFFIPWNVSISPDHNVTTNTSSHYRYLYFNHTIINTGEGADIFDIKVYSSNGFDIKLIINGNLAAEDYNGDGTWDYVNSSYDTDGDGNPDTGVLIPGESFNITIAVKIPSNYTGNETVDVEAYSFLSQSVNDHAYDKIAVVPEINNLLPLLILVVLIPIIKRRRRFILSSFQSR